MLYVIHDFEGRTQSELSIRAGQKVEVIGQGNDEWILCRVLSTEEEGYFPKNYLDSASIATEEWYFEIGRLEAQNILLAADKKIGTFLVRKSETSHGEYALSVKTKTESETVIVKHFRIKCPRDNFYYIQTDEPFSSVSDLIEHYRQNFFPCALIYPCKRSEPVMRDINQGTSDEFEIDRSTLTKLRKIGEGNFGEVWYGKHTFNGVDTNVAIKCLKEGKMSRDAFLVEATIMKKLKHPNLLILYAICSLEEPIYIVTEFMNKGSLLRVLRHDEIEININNMVYIAYQVASGMTYLEEYNLIHRDLSARNVLVKGEFFCKIADFGLARAIEDDEYNPSGDTKFPVKWTAPEYITHNKFTIKSDVWSYGILLYEIFTRGGNPYPGMTNKETTERVCNGYRMKCPKNCPLSIYAIMEKCWLAKPENRYKFSVIVDLLGSLDESEYHPTESF